MNIPYFAFYPHDWLSDSKVQHLTHEERGVYVDLLCHMWVMAGERGDCSLPDDPTFICRLLKIRPAKWTKLRAVLVDGVAPVIYSRDGRLINRRLLKEFEIAKEKSQKAARAAKERWDSERDREQNEGGIPSPTAPEKHGDESPKHASQGHVDDANALRVQCHSDTESEADSKDIGVTKVTHAKASGVDSDPAPPKAERQIAELVAYYRQLPGVQAQSRDYAFMGRLYHRYPIDLIYDALNATGDYIAAGGEVKDPLQYAAGILKRGQAQPIRAAPRKATDDEKGGLRPATRKMLLEALAEEEAHEKGDVLYA